MALEKQTYLDRVLITFNEDETFKGAHQESLECIINDGVHIAEKYLPAEPLTLEALQDILPDRAELLVNLNNITLELEVVKKERDEALEAGNILAQENEALKKQIEGLSEESL